MQPAAYQPRLSRWSQIWRAIAVLAISLLGWSQFVEWQLDHNHLWFSVDLALGALCFILLLWRRRFPVSIALVTAAASGISSFAGGPATLALVSLSTRRKWREIVPVAIVSVAASTGINLLDPKSSDPWALSATAIVSIIGVSIGWGLYIGSRRELLATLRERAVRAESEQSAQVAQSRIAERSRIAREMHDVLAHRISLVSMHAGALTYRTDLSADQMRETADIIQKNSHQALIELREVLGVLRNDPSDTAPELPQPSADDIPALVDEARDSGMRIDFDPADLPVGLPDSIGRTLYRIVQEGLTNARKHATDTRITITVSGAPDIGISGVVSNPLRIGDARLQAPDSGLGLIGLRERAELSGGTLSHSITPERIFILQVWLPWPA